jgi:hypothetical protein
MPFAAGRNWCSATITIQESQEMPKHTHTHKAHGPKHKISLKFFNVLKKDFNEK